MNTADITCVKMTEHNINSVELEVISKIQDEILLNWYDRVYLCYEETDFKSPTTYGAIKGFRCYKFNSFKTADELRYIYDGLLCKKLIDIRHTMIPVCKWVPEIFDKYILNWKLRNIYWGGKIMLGKGV